VALRFIPQVHRATHRVGLHIERLRRPRVTQAEAHVLAFLDAGASTIAEVHRAFAHKRSTLTSILDRLEARQLILRTSDPRDRRTFVISLTARGRTVARRVARHLEAFEARVLASASQAEIRTFLRVLDALDAALDEFSRS
jgi:DNA-binding MarR family transcriptional regulator